MGDEIAGIIITGSDSEVRPEAMPMEHAGEAFGVEGLRFESNSDGTHHDEPIGVGQASTSVSRGPGAVETRPEETGVAILKCAG